MLLEVAPDIEVEEIATLEELEQLQPEWAALWARSASATPFQSPEWLIPWRRQFCGGTLWTLAFRRNGALVGLAPLFVYPTGEPPVRTVLLLGTGVTDYLDILLAPGCERAGAARLFAYLDRHRDRWDLCDFRQLRPASPLLQAAAPAAWQDETAVQEACPVLSLPDDVAAYESACSSRLLKNLRYYRRRAERIGPVRIDAARQENFEALFEALLRLHGARWAMEGLPGMFSEEMHERFHAEAAPLLLARGLLRLYGYAIDGRIVASYYGFLHRNRAYYYLSGFDPELAQLSLGNQIVYHAICDAIRAGAGAFDFLRGQEDYKYRWGAEDRLNRRRRLRHPDAAHRSVGQ